MKKAKYIFIIFGMLVGIFFSVMECLESCLDENIQPSACIADTESFIKLTVIYVIIGAISGWLIWLGIYWLNRFRMKTMQK